MFHILNAVNDLIQSMIWAVILLIVAIIGIKVLIETNDEE